MSDVKIATRVSWLSIFEGAVTSGYSCSMLTRFQTCVSTGFGSICVGMLAEGLVSDSIGRSAMWGGVGSRRQLFHSPVMNIVLLYGYSQSTVEANTLEGVPRGSTISVTEV